MRAIGLVTVFGPLEYIAVHVVEAEGIGRERATGRRLAKPDVAAFGLAAELAFDVGAEVAVVMIDFRPPGERGRRARAGTVFPFSFGRQVISVVLAGLGVQPADEVLRVVPAHSGCRPRAAAPVGVIRIRLAVRQRCQRGLDGRPVTPGVADAGFPLVPGDGHARHRERPRERDFGLRLVFPAERFVGRRAHRERAGRQDDHFGTVAALLKCLPGQKRRALRLVGLRYGRLCCGELKDRRRDQQ